MINGGRIQQWLKVVQNEERFLVINVCGIFLKNEFSGSFTYDVQFLRG